MNFITRFLGLSHTQTPLLTAAVREQAQEKWTWIGEQMKMGKPSNLRLAIIEADKVVDAALRVLYPKAEQMGDRLKLARDRFPDRYVYDDLWYAHKVRNVIVHEDNYVLPGSEAAAVIEKYHRALQTLGVL